MQLKMKNTPIGTRIALALALPIAGFLFFASWMLLGYQHTANEMRDLRAMAELAPAVSDFVHELQQERGTSAGFIGSSGTAFEERLPLRYQQTDQKRVAFFGSLQNVVPERFENRLGQRIDAARTRIDKLLEWRRAVVDQKISQQDLMGNYGEAVAELIEIVKEMLFVSNDSELARSIYAYVNLMQAKELAGIERAIGAARFSAGNFDAASHALFLRLIDRQKVFLDQFRFFASDEQTRFLEQSIIGVEAAEAERMRRIASRNAPGTSLLGKVEVDHWFDTLTWKIDRLKEVEDKLARDLIAEARSAEESAAATVRWVGLATLLALLLTLFFAAGLARGIIYPIKRITRAMNRLAARDEHAGRVEQVEIRDHQRGDEIGEMARSALVFQENLIHVAQAEAQLKSDAILRLHHKALGAISQGVLIVDADGRATFANPALQEITGYGEAEILGRRPDFLFVAENGSDGDALAGFRAALSRGDARPHDMLGQRKNGEQFWSEASITLVPDSRGESTHSVIVLRDITESRSVEQEMRIAATAFETLHGMMVTDAKGVILRVNGAFTEMTGYSAAEVVGKTPAILKSGRHEPEFYTRMWHELASTGAWFGEIWDRRKNGELFPKWQSISAVRGVNGQITHYVTAFSDISERKEAEEQIRSLAFYDPLTGLPNRRLLLDRLQQAMTVSERNEKHGALLFIDLDQFKTLNDTLGHDIGDLLLIEVAKRLQNAIRASDTAARLGGDEFVIMLEDLSGEAGEAAAQTRTVGEKILVALNQPYQLAGHEHHSTPSIGITLFSGGREAIDNLFKQADLAMYQSKAAGRNALRFFDPQMQAVVTQRAELEADLREGIDKGEFMLHYQPQVDPQGRVIGAEALLRWRHPRRGMVLPGEFISLSEETGLILPIGQWVLETACRQLVEWSAHEKTAGLRLAVNVSARQLRQPDFAEQVLATLRRTGANPERLQLELTESLLLDDLEGTIAKMLRLKACGVGFALDDFGTGYSSLSYLKRLPLDHLKIDRSFVRDILTDPNDAVIARTIVTLAHSLGLSVVAEGVEASGQFDFLFGQGCRTYQGYLFGRPGPVETLLAPDTAETP
ncbi:MAG: hypothetical protein BGO63_16415 [Candidatus Accumulibacter sp. 66-26]|nr:MAG: hypothetical protein BGO63_16415 [Candidatus Accumulibacter sp. 66-26]